MDDDQSLLTAKGFALQLDRGRFDEPLYNLLPSKKFPDARLLELAPLTQHFQSRLVRQPRQNALRAIGRLFIQLTADTTRELGNGSAWVSGKDTIITSAHNVFDFSDQAWTHALQFHPAYDYYASDSLPTCRVVSCRIPRAYTKNPASNYDIAICKVDRNIGELVDAEIPIRQVESNDFFDQNSVAIVGYPVASSFDFGKQMWQSRGEYLFGQTHHPDEDFAPVMATDFGGGASGCPWVIKEPFTGELLSVGVTSGHAKLRYAEGESNLMSLVSPFFNSRLFESLETDYESHEFDVDA
jgi:hypothetical protein